MILSDLPSIKYILDSSKMHMFALQNTSHKKPKKKKNEFKKIVVFMWSVLDKLFSTNYSHGKCNLFNNKKVGKKLVRFRLLSYTHNKFYSSTTWIQMNSKLISQKSIILLDYTCRLRIIFYYIQTPSKTRSLKQIKEKEKHNDIC